MKQTSPSHLIYRLVGKLLDARHFLLALSGLALFLASIPIQQGLKTDDFIHLSKLNNGGAAATHELYNFISPTHSLTNDAEINLITWGAIPWWADPELKLSFWRPLSALTHLLDTTIGDASPIFMHTQNTLWYLTLVLACFYFFTTIFENRNTAALATLFFCLDFTNFGNISWIASRNSLICACFCMLSISSYINWRKKLHLGFLAASLLFFALSLLASEAGFITLIFILCHIIFLEKSNSFQIFKNTISHLLIFSIWLTIYQSLEMGSTNNLLYLNPFENLKDTAIAISTQLPVYLFGQIFIIEGFFNVFSPELKIITSGLCTIFVGLFFIFIRSLIINNKFTNFFLAAGTLAILPACLFALTDTRHLLFSSIAFSGLFAIIAQTAFGQAPNQASNSRKPQYSKKVQILALYIIVAHLGINSLQWTAAAIRHHFYPTINVSKYIQTDYFEKYAGQEVILINTPSAFDYYYMPFVYRHFGYDLPASIHILNDNSISSQIKKTDERTLLVQSRPASHHKYIDSFHAHQTLNKIYQSNRVSLEAGGEFEGNQFTVRILKIEPDGSRCTAFKFKNELNAENYIVLKWDDANQRYQKLSFDAPSRGIPNNEKLGLNSSTHIRKDKIKC